MKKLLFGMLVLVGVNGFAPLVRAADPAAPAPAAEAKPAAEPAKVAAAPAKAAEPPLYRRPDNLPELYKKYKNRGLEVVELSFEEEAQLKNPVRVKAFIKKYGIDYTVLLPGEPRQLNEKMPQGVNLNSFPTTFFLGRDGRVRSAHAGFQARRAESSTRKRRKRSRRSSSGCWPRGRSRPPDNRVRLSPDHAE